MGRKSILGAVRSEGYAAGWSQAAMVAHDDAFERGRREAEEQHWRECKRWWWFGLVCGVAGSVLVGALF